MKKKAFNKGFTLVEIMMVLILVAILSGIAVLNGQRQRIDTNDINAQELIRTIATAFESYSTTDFSRRYPASENLLTDPQPPFLNKAYNNRVEYGYTFRYEMDTTAYTIFGTPVNIGVTGTKNLTYSNGELLMVQAVKPAGGGGGSCPFVYSWGGGSYRFEGDVLSFAKLNHPQFIFGKKIAFDPRDRLKLSRDLQAKDGSFIVKFLNNLDDINYIDQATLLVVDHPTDVEIEPDNIGQHLPWIPPDSFFQVKGARPPRAAYNQKGEDLLAYIKDCDGSIVPIQKTTDYGFIEPMTMVLDLGDLRGASQIQLLIQGYFQPGMFREVFSKSFSALRRVQLPYIEVMNKKGRWEKAMLARAHLKTPVMMVTSELFPRPVIIDLTGLFPTDDYRIRVTTNLAFYYDKISVNTHSDYTPLQVSVLKPVRADLHFAGLIEGTFTPGDREFAHYPYEYLNPDPVKLVNAAGSYTRYGDVLELANSADDCFIIMAKGDELDISFDGASLPPLPQGYGRDYVLESQGYYKSIFPASAKTPGNVGPIPFQAMSRYPYSGSQKYPDDPLHRKYLAAYNTRIVAPAVQTAQSPLRKILSLVMGDSAGKKVR